MYPRKNNWLYRPPKSNLLEHMGPIDILNLTYWGMYSQNFQKAPMWGDCPPKLDITKDRDELPFYYPSTKNDDDLRGRTEKEEKETSLISFLHLSHNKEISTVFP